MFSESDGHLETILKSQSFRDPLVHICAMSIMASGTFSFPSVVTPFSPPTNLCNPFRASLCIFFLLPIAVTVREMPFHSLRLQAMIFIYKKPNNVKQKRCFTLFTTLSFTIIPRRPEASVSLVATFVFLQVASGLYIFLPMQLQFTLKC